MQPFCESVRSRSAQVARFERLGGCAAEAASLGSAWSPPKLVRQAHSAFEILQVSCCRQSSRPLSCSAAAAAASPPGSGMWRRRRVAPGRCRLSARVSHAACSLCGRRPTNASACCKTSPFLLPSPQWGNETAAVCWEQQPRPARDVRCQGGGCFAGGAKMWVSIHLVFVLVCGFVDVMKL